MSKIKFEAFPCKDNDGGFRVEAVDSENDGSCYVAEFWGQGADERAREYAEFKNSQRNAVG